MSQRPVSLSLELQFQEEYVPGFARDYGGSAVQFLFLCRIQFKDNQRGPLMCAPVLLQGRAWEPVDDVAAVCGRRAGLHAHLPPIQNVGRVEQVEW
eukprot:scaffold110165_cov37-Prasinocladus_malaysianus.AAC.2